VRLAVLLYGGVSYVVFLVAFLYAIGFVGNLVVPRSIDSPVSDGTGSALLVNVLLLGLFAVQHSVMARPGFKRIWTKVIPPAVERSTFVLLSSIILLLIFWQWRPMTSIVWEVSNSFGAAALWAMNGIGWIIVLISTFLIDHWHLFGLRQVLDHLRQRSEKSPVFTTRGLYRFLRHPIMLGFVVAFWATPVMTVGHLLFAAATTGYILVGVLLEERDLVAVHGGTYLDYRKRVPMLIPKLKAGDPSK
jgi:protein-S-isoprenylcysteine O-methyltransferase Ste14